MILLNKYRNQLVCLLKFNPNIPSSPGLSFSLEGICDKFSEEGSVQCKQWKEKDRDTDWAEIIVDVDDN